MESSSPADGEITQYGTSGDGHPHSLVDCLWMQCPTALLNPALRSAAFVVSRRNEVDRAFCTCHRLYQSYEVGKTSTTGLKAGTMLWKCCVCAKPFVPCPSPCTQQKIAKVESSLCRDILCETSATVFDDWLATLGRRNRSFTRVTEGLGPP